MLNTTSLLFYVFCFSISATLLSIGIKKSSRLLRIIAIAIPILVVGLRVDVGSDYNNYVLMFQQYSGSGVTGLSNTSTNGSSMEIGFLGLIKLTALFTNSAWLMFFLSAALTIGISYFAIKRLSPNSVPITFLLFLFILVPFTTNGVRQGIAMSIVFFAYSYIVRGNPAKYLIAIFVASCFHTSAIVILPLYLLRFITLKKRTDALLTLLSSITIAVFIVLAIPLLLIIVSTVPALNAYSHYEGLEAGTSRGLVIPMICIALVVIASYRRISHRLPNMQLMAAIFFLEFASLFLGRVSEVFARMAFYMAIGGLVYVANVPSIFSEDTRRTAQFIVVGYGLLYFTIFTYIAGASGIFPYKSIWGGL